MLPSPPCLDDLVAAQQELAQVEAQHQRLLNDLAVVEGRAVSVFNRRGSVPFDPTKLLADRTMEAELLAYYGVESGDLPALFRAKKAQLSEREETARHEVEKLTALLKSLEQSENGDNAQGLNRHFGTIHSNLQEIRAQFVAFSDDALAKLKEARELSAKLIAEKARDAQRELEEAQAEVDELERQIREVNEKKAAVLAARTLVRGDEFVIVPDRSKVDAVIEKVRGLAEIYQTKLRELDVSEIFRTVNERLDEVQADIERLEETIGRAREVKSERSTSNWEVITAALVRYARAKAALVEKTTKLQRKVQEQGGPPPEGATEQSIADEIERMTKIINALKEAQTHEELEHRMRMSDLEMTCNQLQKELQDME
jgi:hypothetical protein